MTLSVHGSSLGFLPSVTVGFPIPKRVDNCVSRVNVCGKSPRWLVEPINIINDTGMSDHVLPFGEGISIVSLIKSLTSHCWNEWKRFETSRL